MAKRPVNLNLDIDLVERCRSGIDNLSAHVDTLLAADLDQRQARAAAEQPRTEAAVDAFSALSRDHGSLSEEMQIL